MNLVAFVQKWSASSRTERAAAQEHFIDLCRLLGEPTPNEADPHGAFYAFEKGTEKVGGGDGFADVWFRNHFAWEYKGKRKSLKDAYAQLLQYREDLDNPPLLIVCDLDRFEVHTNFTGTAKRVYTFALADLARDEPSPGCPLPPLDVLRRAFKAPDTLRPQQTTAQVTEIAAAKFAALAQRLQARGEQAEAAAHFLMRLLFCLFAEDAGLLPEKLFKRLVETTRRRSDDFCARLALLFAAMATGGSFGVEDILHFNGGLFADSSVLALTAADMETLVEASALDWSSVEPAIFGTLFERSLDPGKRSQLGAHYTSREDIDLIVEPVLMQPLRRRWEAVKEQARPLIAAVTAFTKERMEARAAGARLRERVQSDPRVQLERLLKGFSGELAAVQVLDPACGSGNFLYVSLKHLLDLEKEVISFAASNGLSAFFPQVGPRQLHGIELNDYAFELAQIVIWIGYLQWLHDNGFGVPTSPILKPLHAIQHMDAVLALDAGGAPREPEWPAATVIVGNPPFLGGKKLRTGLGDENVERLFAVWDGRVPREADLCCYWFEKARAQIAAGRSKRAGLLATQAIRGGKNRVVLERIKQSGDLFYAQADRPWVLDGAAVRIAMVGFDDGSETRRLLNERKDGSAAAALAEAVPVEGINANLTSRADVTQAHRLRENEGIGFIGTQKTGGFELTSERANTLLKTVGNPNGRPNTDVLKPWINGYDVTDRPRNMWIIDFGIDMSIEDAAQYEQPFEYLRCVVLPERSTSRQKALRDRWWLFEKPRPAMRSALAGLPRYLVTPRVGKHRIFSWVQATVLPDTRLVIIARDNDYFFGVLHSRVHEAWSLATSSRHGVGNDPTYNNTTCFETFPFPEPGAATDAEIGAAAAEMNRLREGWLNPPDADELELKRRTLTNLYNARPTWLANVHARLDSAVLRAYGWPADLADEAIVARLLALNLTREPA